VFQRQKFLHVVDVEIRDTPAFYLSGGAQLLERVNSLLEGRRSLSPVQKIKINRVDVEATKTALTGFWQFRA
jgi:hypothetical protein